MVTRTSHLLAFLTAAALLPGMAQAAPAVPPDAMIEGAKLCTRYLPRFERDNGIPVHLLSAIASTESGRWHKGLKIMLPWPWTINAEGKGYYFESKEEALAAARRLRAQGVKSMDVGCMQVNLLHHASAFNSLEEAFEPAHNISYAARFLRNLYDEQGSWRDAAASYHSRTPSFGTRYVSRVYDKWYTILDRVRGAGSATPNLQLASAAAGEKTTRPVRLTSKTAAVPAESGYRSMSTKVIRVRNDTSGESNRRENGVLIYRAPAVPSVPASPSADASPSVPATKTVEMAALSPASGSMPKPAEKPAQIAAPSVPASPVAVRPQASAASAESRADALRPLPSGFNFISSAYAAASAPSPAALQPAAARAEKSGPRFIFSE